MRFLVRVDCHLCEDARPAVRRASRLAAARLVEVDVDTDPPLAAEWGLRIPVVLDPGGRVLGEGRIEFWPLVRSILRARAMRR